ncbi:pentapeptide repeat-containing protein [Streptomyces cremeus]|uniref:Pentapeptide repeat-containing protein n=1 Tax=Streptomyces cremeus TaxID=66881 RepID=A0ABV5PIV7_STRCM
MDFTGAQFSGGTVNFTRVQFSGGTMNFTRARFSDGTMHFNDARFSGGNMNFRNALGAVPHGLLDSLGLPVPAAVALPARWQPGAP